MTISATYPDLDGRAALVTGGASGIGAAICEALAGQGAHVGFIDIDREAGEALAATLRERGAKVQFEQADLRDIEALRSAIARIDDALGPITALVNNAARDDRHDMFDVTPDYWDERVNVNLKHQFFAAQAVAPGMKAAGGGAIVNMGSTSWMMGMGGMPCYTTAKSAVQGLTRSLARDLGADDIRVNCVAPGWIMTERQIELWLTPESEANMLEKQCLKRKLTPEDIARVVLFFLSDESHICTAQTYIADGGWL